MRHQLNLAVEVQPTMNGPSALEGRFAWEVAMKSSSLLIVLIVIMLIVGGTLSVMNKACKGGYHAWCAPISSVRHHAKTQPLPNPS
jgi:hypothetical protein